MKKIAFILFGSLLFLSLSNNSKSILLEQIIASMSLEQKIGQFFVIKPEALDESYTNDQINSYSEYGKLSVNEKMREFYEKYPAGGFVLFNKNLKNKNQLKKLNGELHSLSDMTPLVFIDEEGGSVARIANNPDFEEIKFDEILKEMKNADDPENKAHEIGETIGSYLNEYGIDVDFAPVADVFTNKYNTVIGPRAYSTEPEKAGKFCVNMYKGLRVSGVDGCFKHFPGHGDTLSDSHAGQAFSNKTWNQMLKCEIIPFKMAINQDADFIMTGHISCPEVTGNDLPATVSYELITNKLRKELKYKNIIITDSMIMKAIVNNYTSGESAVAAFIAGADMILMPLDYKNAFDALKNAVLTGKITEYRFNESLRRIISYKLKRGLINGF